MTPYLIATAVAYQCVVTPFTIDGVKHLCKTCTRNDVTSSVICVPVKEKSDEKSSPSPSSSPVHSRSTGLYNVNVHNAVWKDGGVHDMLRF